MVISGVSSLSNLSLISFLSLISLLSSSIDFFLFDVNFLFELIFLGSSFLEKSKGIFNLPGIISFFSSSFFSKLSKGFFNLPGRGIFSFFDGKGKNWNLSSFNFPGIKFDFV